MPNEVEKRTFMWHCNSCNLDFKERMNTVLKRYLTSKTKSLNDICPYCTHLLPNPKTESLDVVKPLLIEEWQSDIYGSISAIFPSSTAKVNWKCRSVRENLKLESVNVKKMTIAVLTVLDEKYYQDTTHLMLHSQS